MRKNILSGLFVLVLMMTINCQSASAAYWSKTITGNQQSLWTFMIEEPIPVPVSVTISGSWKEMWNGTQGSWATLDVLFQSAVHHNKLSSWWVEGIDPYVYYYGNSYFITNYGSWTSPHYSSNDYIEGSTFIGNDMLTNSTNSAYAEIVVTSTDCMPVCTYYEYTWTSHY